MDKFSVLIRNKNEERYIGYAIQSLIDYIGEEFELIIIDNESTDDSLKIVKTFDFLDIKQINISKNDYTPGGSLNRGVRNSTNPYILILSAHCEIKCFDGISVQQKLDDDIVGIWGKQIPIWDGKKISRRYMWSNFRNQSKINYYCDLEDRYFFHNAFSIFKTEYLMENPFDERLSGKEDRYWANDEIEKGKKILYDSTISVHHHYTENGATWKGVG
jgi:rhamnosyltransferase